MNIPEIVTAEITGVIIVVVLLQHRKRHVNSGKLVDPDQTVPGLHCLLRPICPGI